MYVPYQKLLLAIVFVLLTGLKKPELTNYGAMPSLANTTQAPTDTSLVQTKVLSYRWVGGHPGN